MERRILSSVTTLLAFIKSITMLVTVSKIGVFFSNLAWKLIDHITGISYYHKTGHQYNALCL